MVKNCDLGLENAALGLRPRAVFSRPRSQFFTIGTSQPANNIYLLDNFIYRIFVTVHKNLPSMIVVIGDNATYRKKNTTMV